MAYDQFVDDDDVDGFMAALGFSGFQVMIILDANLQLQLGAQAGIGAGPDT